jgi:hypothetical protein
MNTGMNSLPFAGINLYRVYDENVHPSVSVVI